MNDGDTIRNPRFGAFEGYSLMKLCNCCITLFEESSLIDGLCSDCQNDPICSEEKDKMGDAL